MTNLAHAVITSVLYFELADDSEVDPDVAVRAMEEIYYYLRQANSQEKKALLDALAELLADAKSGDYKNKDRLVSFYEEFIRDLDE